MDKLEPCPYCGGTVKFIHDMETFEINGVFCAGCKALIKWPIAMKGKETFGENKKKWLEKWNRRAT